jgi:membrane protease subunit (stomatin/prohibitin family)
MALFGPKHNKGGAFADMIQSPEQNRDWLIYKWRPEGEEAGSTKRENAIRWNSSLTVREGEVAVFQYAAKGAGGQQDYIEGFYSDTIKTANFPVLSSIVGAAFGGGTPFPAQVFFINTAGINQAQFGVPYFDMFDPRLPDHPVGVAVRGAITFRVTDYKAFVGLPGPAHTSVTSVLRQNLS